MDDSFRVRVEKIFGSLKSSSSEQPSSVQSTLWSLTDDEVERREWRRDATASYRDEMPCSLSFDELKTHRRKNFRRELEDDLDELDDDEVSNTMRRRGVTADEWEIRSSIGLDRTLDDEEEEDEYDKVASGRENSGERLFMKNVANQDSYLNIHNVLSKSLHGTKDPRANHMAAKSRLQDEAEARKLNSHHIGDTEGKELCVNPSLENGSQLRSILKRKDKSSGSKSHKRVRFDPGCKIVYEEEATLQCRAISAGSSSLNNTVSDVQNTYGIPDYLRNPSKYTRYSFDSSSEVEEESNTRPCTDYSAGSESELKDASADLPKSVAFIPRKKAVEVIAANSSGKVQKDEQDDGNQSTHKNGLPIGIAAGDAQESDPGVMEDNELITNSITKSDGSHKNSRKYRTKWIEDESDS